MPFFSFVLTRGRRSTAKVAGCSFLEEAFDEFDEVIEREGFLERGVRAVEISVGIRELREPSSELQNLRRHCRQHDLQQLCLRLILQAAEPPQAPYRCLWSRRP